MPDPHKAERAKQANKATTALAAVYVAARADVLSRVRATGDVLNVLRGVWRRAVRTAAAEALKDTAAAIGETSEAFDPKTVDHYLDAVAENFASRWDESTRASLDEIAGAIDATFDQIEAEATKVMDAVVDRAKEEAEDLTGTAANLAAFEAAVEEGKATKTWHTASEDSRASHAALDGVTIPMDERFANGLRYPKSPGPPQETVNCECYLTFGGQA